MSNFIPLPPTYAIADPQVRSVLDVLTRNMQVVIDSGTVTSTNTALTSVGGASTFGSGVSSTNITNLAPSYTLDTLTADLKRGAAEVITGVTNGTTVMKLEPAGQYVVFQHKDAVVLGTTGAYSGTIRTGLGITSTGILGGYNRTSDGAWQTTFAIESATGNLTLLGTIRAASVINVGAYLGSQTVSSVLTDVSTASSNATAAIADATTALANANTALANANTAIADAAAAQADADAAIAALPAKLESTSSYILTGAVGIQNTGGISVGTLTWNSTTGVITGGSGIAITEYGLVGAQAGVAKFYIDSAGNAVFGGSLSAATGTFAGNLSAAGGTFTGTLSAANGTFTGSLSSVGGTFTGALSAASGTFTGSLTSVGGTFTGSLVAATGTFTGSVSAGNILSTGATLGTTSGTNFWLRGSDGAAYFGGETTVNGRFSVTGSFAQSGFGDISAYFASNAGGATIYSSNSGSGAVVYANNTGSGSAGNFYNNTSGTFGLPTFWAINNGTGVALRAQSSGQAALFSSSGGGYAFIAYSSGASTSGVAAFVQGDFALGYSDSRGDAWIMRAPSTSVAAAAASYLNSDGTWKAISAFATTALGTDAYAANRLNGSAGSNVMRFVQGTVSGAATAGFSGTNKPGSASSNTWMQITIDATTLYIPVWT